MNPVQLSVIIVNYNVKFFLEQCLCALQKSLQGIPSEIIVFDNHSTDGSREWLAPKFPAVQFIWNAENLGFSKANNAALKIAKGEQVLFLNPDTIVAEDSLQLCLDFMAKTPDCGALGVRMIDGSGRFLRESKRGLPGPSAAFYKMTGLASLFPRSKKFAAYYQGHLQEDHIHAVDVLAGAFFMSRSTVLKDMGGFDERFFMYGEDVDLSYRIQRSGWKNYYFAGTTILHFKGESTQKLSTSYIDHFYGAMQLFIDKHYDPKTSTYKLMKRSIAAGKRMAFLKMRFKKKPIVASAEPANTLVVADQPGFDKVLQLIKFAQPPLLITGRIEPAQINGFKKYMEQGLQQVLFCEGRQSFRDIIGALEKMPKSLRYLFHAGNSHSIVGSAGKDSNGVFIADEGQR